MLSVVYVSTATAPFSDEHLVALLEKSRTNNTRLELTGLLLYKDGQFMQALEGPDDAVQALYAVIERDPRHRNVRALVREQIAERQFPDWSMGFRTLTDEALQAIPGYSDFLDAPKGASAFWGDRTRAQWLLRWFRRHGV
jgi:hypothetical protein